MTILNAHKQLDKLSQEKKLQANYVKVNEDYEALRKRVRDGEGKLARTETKLAKVEAECTEMHNKLENLEEKYSLMLKYTTRR